MRTALARPLAVLLAIVLFVTAAAPGAEAQRRQKGPSLVRDAEIEALMRTYAGPLMKAAGLRTGSVRFYIVNDDSFNAFVSGNGLFMHTGLLLQAQTPGEVIGVVAHELGHITGGHQQRLRERAAQAMRLAQITTLLGIGLGAAGAAAGIRNAGAAGLGVAAGGRNIAIRDLLRYQREEETAADRAAVRLLRQTGQSGQGMIKTFKRLARQTSLLAGRIDPYLVSHPMPNQRIAALRDTLSASPHWNRKDGAALRLRHDMARAKIAAYLGGSRYARSLLAGKELHPDARLYGRAIVAHLYSSPKNAIPLIDKLIARMPKNAYVWEMKGEIYLRSGRPKQAVSAFRKAIALDRTKAGFLRVELGHALVEAGGRKNLEEARRELRKGLTADPSAVGGWRYLARAEADLGNEPGALLASAELSLRTGRRAEARSFAKRAQNGLKRGTPQWLRAEDIRTIGR